MRIDLDTRLLPTYHAPADQAVCYEVSSTPPHVTIRLALTTGGERRVQWDMRPDQFVLIYEAMRAYVNRL